MYSVAQELQAGSGPGSDYNVVILASQARMREQLYGQGWRAGLALRSISRDAAGGTSRPRRPRARPSRPRPTSSRPGSSYSDGTPPAPALAVGIPLGSYYQLYYVFPLTRDLLTLQLIQRTLILGGIALVVLLALIASLVTRWVVGPGPAGGRGGPAGVRG